MRPPLLLAAGGLLLVCPAAALAGMPAPLPVNWGRYLRLGDAPLLRLQAVSFFLLVFFLCAAAVQLVWNFVRRDFPNMPRISFWRAVAGVFLWGMLFVVVLTMISGARELMTPGAWRKQGFTYTLADPPPAPAAETESDLAVRRQHLEKLRTALWQFAATHNGRFPSSDEVTAIPTELWEVPGAGGLRYACVAGLSAGHLPEVVLYEPELDSDRRLVLKANGDLMEMKSADLRSLTAPGKNP